MPTNRTSKYTVAVLAALALFIDLADLIAVNVALPALQRDLAARRRKQHSGPSLSSCSQLAQRCAVARGTCLR